MDSSIIPLEINLIRLAQEKKVSTSVLTSPKQEKKEQDLTTPDKSKVQQSSQGQRESEKNQKSGQEGDAIEDKAFFEGKLA